MIVIAFALLGGIAGALIARRNGGKPLDLLQYAVALAIVGAVLGLFASIALSRLM